MHIWNRISLISCGFVVGCASNFIIFILVMYGQIVLPTLARLTCILNNYYVQFLLVYVAI